MRPQSQAASHYFEVHPEVVRGIDNQEQRAYTRW